MAGDNDSGKSPLNKPETYDGSETGFRTFYNQVVLYIQTSGKRTFPNDTSKIAFVLSLLKGRKASPWAEQKMQAALFDSKNEIVAEPTFGTWAAFLAEFKKYFENPLIASDAYKKLQSMTQGARQPATEFFHDFERTRGEAGLSDPSYDSQMFQMLQYKLLSKLTTPIALIVTDPPKTYTAYKDIAIKLDQQITEHQRAHQDSSFHISRPTQPQSTSRPAPAPQRQTEGTYANKPNITPMEGLKMSIAEARRKGVCAICDEKGHFWRQCPTQKDRVKTFIRSLQPWERVGFADGMAKCTESDFIVPGDSDSYDPPSPADYDSSFQQSEQ